MGSRVCPHCEQPVLPGQLHCSNCGALLPASLPPSTPGYGNVPASTAFPAAPPAAGPSSPLDAQRTGLRWIELAAILALVGLILSSVPIYDEGSLSGLVSVRAGGMNLSISTGLLELLLVLGLAGIAFDVVMFYLYYRGYSALKGLGTEFRTPSNLSLLAVVGGVLIGIGFPLLLLALVQLASCITPGLPVPSSCVSPVGALLLGGLALLAVGAILLLVGIIGVMIGLWRLGTRYSSSLLKAAAILLIFPFLNIIASILILVETHRLLGRLRGPVDPLTIGAL